MNNEADLKSDPTFFTLLTCSWGSTTQHHAIPHPNQHRCSSLPHYDAMFHRLRSYTLRDTLILSFSSLMSNWVNFVSLRRGIGHIFFQLHSQASMNFFQGNFFLNSVLISVCRERRQWYEYGQYFTAALLSIETVISWTVNYVTSKATNIPISPSELSRGRDLVSWGSVAIQSPTHIPSQCTSYGALLIGVNTTNGWSMQE